MQGGIFPCRSQEGLQDKMDPELLNSAPVNCAVLPRSFMALTPASSECKIRQNPPSSVSYLGHLEAPGFPKSKLKTQNLQKNAIDSYRREWFDQIMHSSLCRRPAHWWGRAYEGEVVEVCEGAVDDQTCEGPRGSG